MTYDDTSWGSRGETSHEPRRLSSHEGIRETANGGADGVTLGRFHDGDGVTVNNDAEWVARFGKGRTTQRAKFVIQRGNAAAWIGVGGGITVGYWFLYWLRGLVGG